MTPQSEPGEQSHNAQERMSPPREDRVLGTCSGKWGPRKLAQDGVFLPLFVKYLLSTYKVSHAILDTRDTSVTKETRDPCLLGT